MSGGVKVAAVVGATASGKTALAVELARRLNGEVISADSMQIYRGLSVATAKPTAEETRGIPHHLIDFVPLDERELEALGQVCAIFRQMDSIPCTSCRYCIEENQCAMDIVIPELFAAYNTYGVFHSWNTKMYYHSTLTKDRGKASDCIGCGGCEYVCPQHLNIRELLKDVAGVFEKR